MIDLDPEKREHECKPCSFKCKGWRKLYEHRRTIGHRLIMAKEKLRYYECRVRELETALAKGQTIPEPERLRRQGAANFHRMMKRGY